MKTTIIVLASVALATALGAQPKKKLEKPEKAAEVAPPAPVPQRIEPSRNQFEFHSSFARASKLAGYNDPRYVADDKTDYLKGESMTGNLEFAVKMPYSVDDSGGKSPLQDIFAGTDFLRFGGQLTTWWIPHGSSVSIPKLGPPVNSSEPVSQSLNSMTRPGIGFFFGFGKKDFELDIGIHLSLDIQCEGSRTRRVFDANGNAVVDASGNAVTEQVPGRDCSPASVYGLPTLKFAWGKSGNLQYILSAGRESFEYHKDFLQTYFRIPVASFMRIDIGVGLYPNATLFLQPNFDIGPITLGIRGGLSLNHYESELRRVALKDAVYFGASLSGRF